MFEAAARSQVQVAAGAGCLRAGGLLLHLFQIGALISREVLDEQFIQLHKHDMHKLKNDVVIVGIDEEAQDLKGLLLCGIASGQVHGGDGAANLPWSVWTSRCPNVPINSSFRTTTRACCRACRL
jgi:hypothetical protein